MGEAVAAAGSTAPTATTPRSASRSARKSSTAEGRLIADLAAPDARLVVAQRRRRGAWQRALRDADASDASLRGDGAAGRGRRPHAPAQARGRRGAGGAPECRQVLAAAADLEREAQGRRLPVHDDRAGPRHRRRPGRPPAHGCGRSGPDRRRSGRRRPRSRVPGPPGAGQHPPPRHRRVRPTISASASRRSTASLRRTALGSISDLRSSS